MSQFRVQAATLRGSMTIPASKSHTLRAVLFATMAKGRSVIRNPLWSADTQSMIEACRLFGAKIEVRDNALEITGVGGIIPFAEDVIQSGNSGIVLRFCAAVGALSGRPIVITGDHSIRHRRPIRPLLEGLEQLGVSTTSLRGDGYAPVMVQGPLQPGKAIIDGEDSQPVSALLIAAAFAKGQTVIEVRNAGEKAWVALTLGWFDRLGIAYEHREFERYILPGHASIEGFEYQVPGDLSSAAFPVAGALVTRSELSVTNVDMTDLQGDKRLFEIFGMMGAKIVVDESAKTLHVRRSRRLQGVSVDLNECVDAITILAVVACYAEGETHLYNAAISRKKECDRIGSIAKELRCMGADVTECDDGLRIRGSTLTGASVFSHYDHRMAMSLAVAGLGATGETVISAADCVSKTFPTFAHDFRSVGASLVEVI